LTGFHREGAVNILFFVDVVGIRDLSEPPIEAIVDWTEGVMRALFEHELSIRSGSAEKNFGRGMILQTPPGDQKAACLVYAALWAASSRRLAEEVARALALQFPVLGELAGSSLEDLHHRFENGAK
jgi:hypothetical protein